MTKKTDDILDKALEGLSLDQDQEHPLYIYCNTKSHMTQFNNALDSHIKSSTTTKFIFLDCEGRDLGRIGGKLGLVQIGIDEQVYLIDVITYPQSFEPLKVILENPEVEKVVWDGRSDFAALWHGHDIAINSVFDLQLVCVYISSGGRKGSRGFIKLEGLGKTFRACPRSILIESKIDLIRLAEGFWSYIS